MRTIDQDITLLFDQIKYSCGQKAKEDVKLLCLERKIDYNDFWAGYDLTQNHLNLLQEVWDKWHTTNKFKVGDKVYVVPVTHTTFNYCIRATVTEVSTDKWGYHLRAFESDLPAIFMFNMWDKDLIPRTDKKRKLVPKELLI